MNDEETRPDRPSELRRQAEEKAREVAARRPESLGKLSFEEQQRLLHELRVHEIELEMQNDELRATQARLESSRERYFDLYDRAPVGYLTISEAGLILEANLTAAGLLGVPRGALAKKPISRFVLPEDQDVYYLYRKQLFETELPQVCELRMLRQAGPPLWVRIDATVAREPDGARVCRAVVSDADERKRAERALQESEERYQSLARISPVGVFRTDAKGATTYVNPTWCRLAGLSPDEALGEGWLSAVHPDDRQGLIAGWREASRAARPSFSEYRLVRGDGTVASVLGQAIPERNAEGEVVGYVGTITDISERKRAEDALRESEERYRLLVEMESDALLLIDNETGRILEANGAAATLYGFTREELLARKNTDLSAQPEETQRVTQGTPVISDQVVTIPVRIHRKKDGTEFPVEITGRFFESRGRPVHIAAIRDISERKRVEQALEGSRAQLLQAQKMEAVGRLAGGVAHDFNNLLQAMLSLATVLQLRAGSPELARIVAEIAAYIKRGADLTQQLLLFSRRQVAEKKRLDLGELASAVGVLLRRLIPANIRLTVDTTPGRLWVDGDAGQLQQVLINLAVNAKDAMLEGGALTLRTSRAGGAAVVEVIDTGHGMDEETRSHLFEPFFTTKEIGKGTGLGLSVAHGIVEQHGGRIEVESTLGEGSVFRFSLPAMPAPAEAADEPNSGTELPRGHGERVLIVEDEEGARKGLTELLAILGYTVTAAGSGEAAEVLPAEPAPDLLLTDLMLPGIDGAALAGSLRQRWPRLVVVLMSGYPEDEAVRRGVSEGEVRFLQKPFDLAALARALHAALGDTAHGEGGRQ